MNCSVRNKAVADTTKSFQNPLKLQKSLVNMKNRIFSCIVTQNKLFSAIFLYSSMHKFISNHPKSIKQLK